MIKDFLRAAHNLTPALALLFEGAEGKKEEDCILTRTGIGDILGGL